jgi:hypothetical protein
MLLRVGYTVTHTCAGPYIPYNDFVANAFMVKDTTACQYIIHVGYITTSTRHLYYPPKKVEDTVEKLEDELAILLDAIEAPEWGPLLDITGTPSVDILDGHGEIAPFDTK